MSYDLFIYSDNDKAVAKEELKSELEKQGWKIAFLSGSADAILKAQGPMEESVVVAGWDADDKEVAQFEALASQGNIRELMKLAGESEAAVGCVVYVTIPYDYAAGYDVEELEEFKEMNSPDYIEAVSKAKSHYYVRTAAGRSPLSFDYQEQVWRVIGDLAGGLIEDPQEGTHEIKAPK